MQPYLTDCGHYLCNTCRGRAMALGRDECPVCREPNGAKDARLNKHLQRKMNSLKVRCQHHEIGCELVGELTYLKEHLDPLLRRCGFILIDCPLECGERVRNSAVDGHIRNYCSKLEFRLLPVEFTITALSEDEPMIMSPHFYTHPQGYKVCLQVQPNGPGSHMSIFVCLLSGKHDNQLVWPLELDVTIELLNWREDKGHHKGTVTFNSEYYQVTMNGIKRSLGNVIFIHHSLLFYDSSTNTEYLQNNSIRLRINAAIVHSTLAVVPGPSWQGPLNMSQSVYEFMLTNFSKRKQYDNTFFSPPFSTYDNGYKMCLVVYANGFNDDKNGYVSVYVQLMAGDNDDQLQWPFVGDIVIELVNWKEDKRHHSKTISIVMASGFHRVTGRVGNSFGLSQFISHSSLRYNRYSNTMYLQDDSLYLRVKRVFFYSTALSLKTPIWQDPNASQPACEFTLTQFTLRKQFNNHFYGPPFYTHQHGYKMRVEVYSDGFGLGKDTHISVYVRLMAGDYDDQLQWPFTGDFDIMLLNWQEDKGHFKKTISIKPERGFVRVLEGTTGNSLGDDRFISLWHSSLQYFRSTTSKYLEDDCLRFRVNTEQVDSHCVIM